MKGRRLATILLLTAVVALGTAPVASAHGGCNDTNDKFCAFDYFNYVTLLTSFKPAYGQEYSVAANRTSSVANHNPTYGVCGVEAEGWPDHTVVRAGPTQHIPQLGEGANNTIEHFYTC
jgi:hypothetical protein